MVPVNYLAVILAALSSMVVGSLWYMPKSFGNLWMKYTGVRPNRSNMAPGKMAWMYGSVFIASLVMAYVLAAVTYVTYQFFHDTFLTDALLSGVMLWLGFTAARLYVHDTFEERRKKLTLLNASHELVTVLVMAVIIGVIVPVMSVVPY